ncbi:MAG: hypothetical protein ACE5KI_07505, partial [Dehalococcoidia bacterium]
MVAKLAMGGTVKEENQVRLAVAQSLVIIRRARRNSCRPPDHALSNECSRKEVSYEEENLIRRSHP